MIQPYFDEDEKVQQEARHDLDNEDCLVRIYLGERETVTQQSDVYYTVRDFLFRLNMMEDLDIDTEDLASEMAIGLAIIRWQAEVDGMDTEFVLGSSAAWEHHRRLGYVGKSAKPHRMEATYCKPRSIHMWMLDFDKATTIDLTIHDANMKLVPAFLGNDPYYPIPQVDEELWDESCKTYLKTSENILRCKGVDRQVQGLPKRFLDEVLRVSKELEDWNEENNTTFTG